MYTNGKLKAIVKKKKWLAPMVWLNETNANHYCQAVDKTWSGVISVTPTINPAKNYTKFYETALSKAVLIKGMEEAL